MKKNPWFKLAAVSLAGIIISFVLLLVIGRFSQYSYGNAFTNMQGYRSMIRINTPTGNWSNWGNYYMPRMNMQSRYMGTMCGM